MMQDRQHLERRVRELEARLAHARGFGRPGIRYRSDFTFGNLPLVAIALGGDAAKGEFRGHAKGVIAIGDIATGVVAIGGFARGLVALGGFALGAVSFGGLSLGALVAVGGLAIGSFAFGGAAAGHTATGGAAAGYFACGGATAGVHVISPVRSDPEAVAHYQELGMDSFCPGDVRRSR
jgi:hypothetical protein